MSPSTYVMRSPFGALAAQWQSALIHTGSHPALVRTSSTSPPDPAKNPSADVVPGPCGLRASDRMRSASSAVVAVAVHSLPATGLGGCSTRTLLPRDRKGVV